MLLGALAEHTPGNLPAGQTAMVYEVRGEWARTGLEPVHWVRWWKNGLQTLARKTQTATSREAPTLQQVPAGRLLDSFSMSGWVQCNSFDLLVE